MCVAIREGGSSMKWVCVLMRPGFSLYGMRPGARDGMVYFVRGLLRLQYVLHVLQIICKNRFDRAF